ncbi:MAG: MlaD family protein [Terracidiphilus sp.]
MRTHYFRIGSFVLIGALLLIGGLLTLGLRSYLGPREIFETAATGKVEDLSVGALVKLRGVTIGKVSSIDFAGIEYPEVGDQYVIIRFAVPKGRIWRGDENDMQQMLDREAALGLRARVQSQGLIGSSMLVLEYLDPETHPIAPIPFKPKHYYVPSAPGQVSQLLASLEESLRHIENLDLAKTLDHANTMIDSATHVARNIDRIDFKGLGTNAVDLVVEVRESNRGLQRTLIKAQSAITDAQKAINGAEIPALSRNTVALEDRLCSAAIEFRHVLASLDTEDLNGSLANIRNATDELIVLLQRVEQRPSSVLFSKPPQPVSGMEKPPRK